MKYCGVATPFRGVRAYTRFAVGMPGSETALEELMCRVLEDCLQDGIAAKLADDLYCGADIPEKLLQNWQRVLDALQRCNLHLSASKTTISPQFYMQFYKPYICQEPLGICCVGIAC